jgi:membrane protein
MSYYFVLSMFPFLIVLASLVAVLPFTGMWEGVLEWMTLYFPRGSQHIVFQIVLGLTEGRAGFLSLGLAGTIWAATNGLMSLIDALDRVYEVPETRGYLKRLGLAILMIFVLAILALATFGLLSAGGRIDFWLLSHSVRLLANPLLWRSVRWVTPVVALGVCIAIVDRTMPNVRRRPWRWTLPGVVFILAGWLVSTALFNLYAEYVSTFNKTYGVLGVFVLLMIWIYFLSVVVLIGAAINCELSKMRDRRRVEVRRTDPAAVH